MRRSALLSMLFVLPILSLGCGGDDSPTAPAQPPAPTFENIAGTYIGTMAGITQGIILDGTFSITIVQSGGTLSGSTATVGTLTDATGSVPISGTGSIAGTIGSGTNPSVNITVTTGVCPNYKADFSGTYDSANTRITLIGPIDILNNSCVVVLTYPSTIVLDR